MRVFPQNFEIKFIRTRDGYWRSVLVFGSRSVELRNGGSISLRIVLSECLTMISHRTGLGVPRAGDTSDLPELEL